MVVKGEVEERKTKFFVCRKLIHTGEERVGNETARVDELRAVVDEGLAGGLQVGFTYGLRKRRDENKRRFIKADRVVATSL